MPEQPWKMLALTAGAGGGCRILINPELLSRCYISDLLGNLVVPAHSVFQ